MNTVKSTLQVETIVKEAIFRADVHAPGHLKVRGKKVVAEWVNALGPTPDQAKTILAEFEINLPNHRLELICR